MDCPASPCPAKLGLVVLASASSAGEVGAGGGAGGEGTFLCFSFSLPLAQIPLTKDRPRIEFILSVVLWETEILPLCF